MNNALKWIATVLFLLAAVLVSTNTVISKYAFPLFLVGHIALTWVFARLKDIPMTVQNAVFIVIDLIGVINWWL